MNKDPKELLAEEVEFAKQFEQCPSFKVLNDYIYKHSGSKNGLENIKDYYDRVGSMKMSELVKDGHLKVFRSAISNEIERYRTSKVFDSDLLGEFKYGQLDCTDEIVGLGGKIRVTSYGGSVQEGE